MSQTPTNGNILILTFWSYDAGSTRPVSGISETGVAWDSSAVVTGNNGGREVEIWKGSVGPGATTSITVTLSHPLTDASASAIVDVCEYSGLAGTADQTKSNIGNGATGDSGTKPPTTQANELLVAAIGAGGPASVSMAQNNALVYGGGVGVSLLDGADFTSATAHSSSGYIEKTLTAAGTEDAHAAIANGANWAGCVATFKTTTTTSSPPTTPNPQTMGHHPNTEQNKTHPSNPTNHPQPKQQTSPKRHCHAG